MKISKYDYDKILKSIEEEPGFHHELLVTLKTSSYALRYIYKFFLIHQRIVRFRYAGSGSGTDRLHHNRNIRPFIIYFKKGDELKAWKKINKTFNLNIGVNKWKEIGRPLLGKRVHSIRGKYTVRGEE